MKLELQKYECQSDEYLIYDCNRNDFIFGAREAKVMCSVGAGLCTKRVLVGPIIDEGHGTMTVVIYNPDGTESEPQVNDIKVFSKYLVDAGYDRTPRSGSGACSDDEQIHKVYKMQFFDNFIEKYNLKQAQ